MNRTVQDLVRHLRSIAPDWTWTVKHGECLVDYATPSFPWGRAVPALLVREPNRKTRRRCGVYEDIGVAQERNRQARQQMDAAHAYLVSIGGQGKSGWFMAVPNTPVDQREASGPTGGSDK